MAVSDGFVEYLRERLASVPGLRLRRMFGGIGVYAGERFFGIVADDTLYLRLAPRDLEAARAGAAVPFAYARGTRRVVMDAYHAVPADVLEDDDRLAGWAARAVEEAASGPVARRRSSIPGRKASTTQ